MKRLLLTVLAPAAVCLPACSVWSQSGEANCIPTAIIPYMQVNNGAWDLEGKVTVAPGSRVTLGPQPASDGSWKWAGPNGFTSSSRENSSVPVGIGANVYTATYTDSSGCVSTFNFTITVTDPGSTASQTGAAKCTATAIIPYMQVNGGSWDMVSSETIAPGASVTLGPQPTTGGSWKWAGPNGFTSSSRENYSVPLSAGSNVYVATYTDPSGCVSTANFTIAVTTPGSAASQTDATKCTPTAITPYMQVNGGSWDMVSSETVAPGASVTLGPQPTTGGSWSWSGPRGFTSSSRENYSVPLSTGSNVFVATYTDPSGCASKANFTIAVTPK